MISEGDIVEIPLPDGRVAIGWILHLSQHFKHAVGFSVFGIKGQFSIGEIDLERIPNELKLLYTSMEAIEFYAWKKVGDRPLLESKTVLTKRIVGGGVYIADNYVGTAEEVQGQELPKMLLYGMIAVYQTITHYFPLAEK